MADYSDKDSRKEAERKEKERIRDNPSQHESRSKSHENRTSERGFASMPKERVQQIAQKGGQKRAEELGSEGYAELGRKGGEASHGGGRHRESDNKSSNKKTKR